MYLTLLKIIYKTQIFNSKNNFVKPKNLIYLKKLGAFFIIKTSTKPRNHVFFQKHTNSLMQWNLYAWGLQLKKLKPHPVGQKFTQNLYLFYQCTSGELN